MKVAPPAATAAPRSYDRHCNHALSLLLLLLLPPFSTLSLTSISTPRRY
jgi:hypothetical protein